MFHVEHEVSYLIVITMFHVKHSSNLNLSTGIKKDTHIK